MDVNSDMFDFNELRELIKWNKSFGIDKEETMNDIVHMKNIKQYKYVLELRKDYDQLQKVNEELIEKLSNACNIIQSLMGISSEDV